MSDVVTTEREDEAPGAVSSSSEGVRLFDPAEILSMTDGGFRACLQLAWGKRLAILDSGFVGLVPGHAQIGDAAAILFGCSLPLILRRDALETYRLVGESYIHGASEGELFDAPQAPETVCFALV